MSATTITATVVSRKGCVQCNATYRSLDAKDIEYTVDLDEASADHALALQLAHQQAPVVLVKDAVTGELIDHWSGFRPDKIDELALTQALVPA